MNLRTKHSLLAAVAGLALATLAVPALAVTKTPVTFTDVFDTVIPGTSWISGHIVHVRGEVDSGVVVGDLTGTISIVFNFDRDLNGPNFTGWGTAVITTANVTWQGTFRQHDSTGSFEAQGTDGSKLLGTFIVPFDGTVPTQAIILQP